jgi:hypothetical protein
MKGPPPPLRFLVAVVGGWMCLRAAVLAPEWWTETAVAEVREPAKVDQVAAVGQAAATGQSPTGHDVSLPRASFAALVPGAPFAPLHPSPFTRQALPALPLFARSLPTIVAPAAPPQRRNAAPVQALALIPHLQPQAALAGPGRWSASAWIFARGGDGDSLAAGGSLGGSQAGLRLLYRLDRRLSLSARLYSPLEHSHGAEAALGIEWQPARFVPLRLLAERRQALGRDGRSAFAILAHGGVSERPVAGPVILDAYAQAGVVGLSRRDRFADGAMRLSLPLDPSLSAGAGLWAAAQPGVSRVDLGPSIALRHRIGQTNWRLTADWRFRISGDAAPGSGPAITLASDF